MNIERVNMVRQFVRLGNIAYPDELGVTMMSPGADFLDTAAISLMEAIEHERIVPDRDFNADGEWRGDVLQEIASESIPTYTYDRWAAFADLCAFEYQWDDAQLGSTLNDMADSRLIHIAYTAMHEWVAEHLDTGE